MRIHLTVHGLLTVAVKDPGGRMEVEAPEGTDVLGLIEILCEQSPVFDPRSSPIAVIDGVQAPLDRVLQDGQHLHLYPIFGGG
jgi:hypothetical protein